MERTKTEIIGPSFLKFDETADYFNDVDTAENLLYGVLTDQKREDSSKIRTTNIRLG